MLFFFLRFLVFLFLLLPLEYAFLILFHLTTLSFLFHLMLYLSFCLSHFCACVSLHTDMSLSFCHLTAFTLFHFSTLSLSLSLSLSSLSPFCVSLRYSLLSKFLFHLFCLSFLSSLLDLYLPTTLSVSLSLSLSLSPYPSIYVSLSVFPSHYLSVCLSFPTLFSMTSCLFCRCISLSLPLCISLSLPSVSASA